MILDTYSGRSLLSHLSRLAETLDLDLFFGDSFSTEGFNDGAAGRFLDPVYQTGRMGLVTSCALPAGDVFALDWSCFHFQTTRCRLDGESAREETREDPFRPKHGCRKDHRPDLKPIVLTTWCVDDDSPILGSVESDNASDPTLNQELLTTISQKLNPISDTIATAN